MDDSTLDKLFSDGLNEEQEFDFREEDWTELEDRLEEKGKRRWMWVWWAAAACLVLSVGMNVWQAKSLREISQLQETLKEDTNSKTLPSAKTTQENTTPNIKPPTSNDVTTTAQQQVIIQRDTIIQRVEVPVYVYPKELNPVAQTPKKAPFTEPTPQNALEDSPKNPDKLFAEEAQQFIDDQPVDKSRLDLLPALPLADIAQPLEDTELPLNGDFLEEYDAQKIIKATKTRRWQMGPTLAYNRIANRGCVNQSNGGIGWEVDYRVTPKWAVQGNYSYNRVHSTCISNYSNSNSNRLSGGYDPAAYSDNDEQLENLFISELDANNIPDTLYNPTYINNIRSRQRYFQVSLGTKYQLPKAFFVSGRIAAYHHFQKNNDYNVSLATTSKAEGLQQGISSNARAYDSSISKAGLIIDRLEIGAGREFKLNDKWRMPVEVYYQKNLNTNDFSLPPLLGVRAGFLFDF